MSILHDKYRTMTDDFNFRLCGNFDVQSIQNKIKEAQFDWDAFSFRQEKWAVHKSTKTTPLLFNEQNFREYKEWPAYHFFKNEIEGICSILNKMTAIEGIICNAILIKLTAHSEIPIHIDKGVFFKDTRRLHLPIVTNPGCLFTVGGETINMKEGEIWEINNFGKQHSVINQGDEDRIHMVMDWKAKE